VLVLFMTVFCRGEGFAGGVHDFPDAWPIDADTARSLLSGQETPRFSQRGFLVMIGQGRLFEMPELNQRFISLGGNLPTGAIPIHLSGQWEQTGSDLFMEDSVAGRLLLGRNQTWGVSGRWLRQTLGGLIGDSNTHLGLLWGMKFQAGEIRGRFQVNWPLTRWSGSAGDGRRENILNLTMVTSHLAGAVVVDRHDDGTPRPGFHLLLTVDGGVGLEFRADPATGSLGPGLSLIHGRLMLRTSHLIHPHLGVTHRLMLVVGKPGKES